MRGAGKRPAVSAFIFNEKGPAMLGLDGVPSCIHIGR